MRTYERTHSWITFTVDLQVAPYKIWMLLGEAQSKCYHIRGVPLLPDVSQELLKIFLAKGALATTAIEGNTLTEAEVRRRIEGKLKLPPSKEYLGQEIDNVVAACNELLDKMQRGRLLALSADDIKQYNRQILNNLPLEEGVVPGEIRNHGVVVGRYQGAPAEDCEYLLDRLCNWLNTEIASPTPDDRIAFGILKAIVAHVYMAWIHPFGDGNGRTARLLEFQIMLASGVPVTTAHLLSNHYNQTRAEYYRQLDQAHRSGGNILPFIHYALQGLVDELKGQIDLIQQQQLSVHWVNYVHDVFRDQAGATQSRRRHLVLDLSTQEDPVPFERIRRISPRLAEDYARKSEKTVKRDLNALEKMGLIVKTGKGKHVGYRAKSEIILGFLPGAMS